MERTEWVITLTFIVVGTMMALMLEMQYELGVIITKLDYLEAAVLNNGNIIPQNPPNRFGPLGIP